ncbi:MAG: WhiB family transcriptional regulator [Acidimicrobiales bacterium]
MSEGPSPLADEFALRVNGHVEADATRQFVSALMDPNGTIAGIEELVRRPKWQERSACRNEDTSTFFPVDGVGLAVARRICTGCPVISECRAFACADSSLKGIWAGMSERERARERQRARGRPAA